MRLDPAAVARTSLGPAAYAEYEQVFGSRLVARWPRHLVLDGLVMLDLLLESGNLLIHPRCSRLRDAFQTYARQRRGGEWCGPSGPLRVPSHWSSARFGRRQHGCSGPAPVREKTITNETGNPEGRVNSEFSQVLYRRAVPECSRRCSCARREIGWSILKHFAPATLDHDGKLYYFTSEEARRQFAKRLGLTL